uniref:Uncharacterized protein n=1 Tax=Arundo donax TaxID=35708 RepID=A0A0A9AQX7_ARUDO
MNSVARDSWLLSSTV